MAIKFRKSKKNLSVHGGLPIVAGLLNRVGFDSRFSKLVPSNPKRGKNDGIAKLKAMIYGFICECQCLDDMELLGRDPILAEVVGAKVYTARSYGNFLRKFTPVQIKELQDEAINLNLALRADLERQWQKSRPERRRAVMILDCDSTKNIQHGIKMEGVARGRDNKLALDTQNIYDELGFQYHLDVRAGNSHSSLGAGLAIGNVIRKVRASPYYLERKIWTRLDSGYYGAEVINSVQAAGSDIIVKAAQTKAFPKILSQLSKWHTTPIIDLERIKFYDDRECEIATTNYRLSKATNRLRHVVVRAKKDASDTLYPDHIEYDYFAIATSLDELRLSDDDLIRIYRGRGNAENFIRENKHGFDLLHYPCSSLTANKAFGAIAMLAYNLMRWLGLADINGTTTGKPRFSKYVRNHILAIPCQLTRTGRDRLVHMNELFLSRVTAWINRIKNMQFGYHDSPV